MTVRASADQPPAVALDSAASAIASARRAVLADRYAANSFAGRMARSDATGADRRRMARACGARARAERVLRAGLCARRGPGIRARGRRGAGLVGDRAAPVARLLSGARSKSGATAWSSGSRRLDASLRAARRAAGRARGGRADHGRLAGASRRRSGAAGIAAVALFAGRRSVRRRARGDRATRADAGRRFQSPQRALLAPAGDRSRYVEKSLGQAPAKGAAPALAALERERRGVVHRSGRDCGRGRAIDDFLALEAGGWKGRAGTAVGRA